MIRIVMMLICLGLSLLIPFYYYDFITLMVSKLSTGWVFSTIFLRFLCIVFFALALNFGFSLFERTRKIKFIFVFLISILPGFGISFITPIYNTDYGDFSDDIQLDMKRLKDATHGNYNMDGKRHIAAFFSVDCGHCQNASRKIGINQLAGQEIAVYAFFMQPPAIITQFLAENVGQDFDAFEISDQNLFVEISGFEFPSVFLIDRDGSTMKHWAGDVMNYSTLDYLQEIEP